MAMDGVVKGIRRLDTGVVVDVSGEVTLDDSPRLHKKLVEITDANPSRLIINMTEVTHIDSSGVGTLVDVYRRVHANGGRLLLFGLSTRVRGIFEITKLDSFFTIVESEDEALAP
jgi:anti-sigma B factor antagonist